MPTSKKKKNLSLSIANLLDPTPSDIINDDDWDKPTVDTDDEEELDLGNNNLNDIEDENRLYMRSDISLTQGKYKGISSSRKNLGLPSLSDDDQEEFDQDEEMEESSSSNEEIDSYHDAIKSINENVFKQAEELATKSQQIEEQIKTPSITLVNSFEKEQNKAKHTRNQQKIWDGLLKLRIKEQRSLILSNRLPQYDIIDSFSKDNDSIKSELTNVSNSIQDILSSLIQVGYELRAQHSQFNSSLPEGIVNLMSESSTKQSRKRKRAYFTCDDETNDPVNFYWSLIEEYSTSSSDFYKETLDFWQKKTQLASRISQTKFKAINQSIVSQVDAAMNIPDKLIEKTQQLKSTNAKIIGKSELNSESTVVDPEIFDDSSFYQQLLKSLIEQDVSADPTEITRNWLKSREKKKQKKDYNSRLSKDRVLKFNVHEKLVDFMTPTEEQPPQYADDLFKNLFK